MTTNTKYQAQLPLRNHRIVTPRPLPQPPRPAFLTDPQRLASELKHKISEVLLNGFWYCYGCESITEREEGEQGQPAHCGRCGSARVEWQPPVHQAMHHERFNPEAA